MSNKPEPIPSDMQNALKAARDKGFNEGYREALRDTKKQTLSRRFWNWIGDLFDRTA